MHNIETGQAIVKHETPKDSDISINNPLVRTEINYRLGNELNEIILSPVIGVQKVRKVLVRYGLDIPALYDLEPEGDEVVLEMDQFGKVVDSLNLPQFDTHDEDQMYYLYMLYYLNDEGSYDFYVELATAERIEEIFIQDEELDEEDDVRKS